MVQRVFSRLVEVYASALPERAVRTVFDVGARDCDDSLQFARAYGQARVHAFECNPDTLPACRRAAASEPRLILTEKAVTDRAGRIAFFQSDPQTTLSEAPELVPGTSSMFEATGNYPEERYAQKRIEVEATTLADHMATHGIEAVDILWMDVQGAEKLVLEGLGQRIRDVACIHLEVEFFEIYKGQAMYADLDALLASRGFRLGGFTSYSRYAADAVYFRADLNVSRRALWRRHPYLLRNWRKMLQHRAKRAVLGALGLPRWPAPRA